MKPVKQDISVWVKCSDELPEDKRHPNGTPEVFVLRCHFQEYVQYRIMTPNQITDFFKGTVYTDTWEWKKPIKQVYVLTEEELETFSANLVTYMYDAIKDAKKTNNLNFSSEEVYKQFIQCQKTF